MPAVTTKNWIALSAAFDTFVNQKHNSTLGSITAKNMSKIPIQYQLANISTSTIMNLTITENSTS